MEKYFVLLDKDTSRVNPIWKGLHLIFLSSITFSGFIAGYCMGRSYRAFGGDCILYADLTFIENTPKNYELIKLLYEPLHMGHRLPPINLLTTVWGPRSVCYLCQFIPLVSSIFGLIWFLFFIICSRGGSGYYADTFTHPWRIVFPALLFGIVFAILSLVSFIYLYRGATEFCKQFEQQFYRTECTERIDDYTTFFVESKINFYVTVRLAIIASMICLISWFLHTFILVLRITCIADFDMVKVKAKAIGEKDLLSFLTRGDSTHNVDMIAPTIITERGSTKSIDYFPSKGIQSSDGYKNTLSQDVNIDSTKSSPSINYIDESPFNENDNSTALVPIKAKFDQSKNVKRAPRVEFSNL